MTQSFKTPPQCSSNFVFKAAGTDKSYFLYKSTLHFFTLRKKIK